MRSHAMRAFAMAGAGISASLASSLSACESSPATGGAPPVHAFPSSGAPTTFSPVVDLLTSKRGSQLMCTALSGAGGLEKYEASLSDCKRRLIVSARWGKHAVGHPGIVHGGATAALVDETCGALFLSSGLGSGFTANLNVGGCLGLSCDGALRSPPRDARSHATRPSARSHTDYKAPLPAGTDFRVVAWVEEVSTGKGGSTKVWVASRVESDTPNPKVFAQARALFVVKKMPLTWTLWSFFQNPRLAFLNK